jgi:hypothetical protein
VVEKLNIKKPINIMMSRLKRILLLVLLSLLISTAYAVKIEFVEYPEVVYTMEKSSVKFKIINDGLQRDTFYLSVWPSNWVSLEKYFVTLSPGEGEAVQFTVEPPMNAVGNIIFSVSARSIDTAQAGREEIILNIKRRTGTYISDIRLNQDKLVPKETLVIQPILVNLDKTQSKQIVVKTRIVKDDRLIKMFEDELLLQPDTEKSLSIPFEIKNTYEYGIYSIQVSLYDKFGAPIHSKTSSFEIKKYSDFHEDRQMKRSLLETTFVINITNKGNYPQSFVVKETMPKAAKYFFYPEIEPTGKEEKENRVVYTWVLDEIRPDESATLVYHLRFGKAAFVLFIILLLASFMLSLFYKPALLKKYSDFVDLEKGNVVTLHVRNNSIREIHNVVVKDVIPPVFTVVKEFETVKPDIKVTPTGTTLVWKIDRIKPREDSILTYRIKPVMHIEGKMRLPKAYFSYKSGKMIISKVAEKIVALRKK